MEGLGASKRGHGLISDVIALSLAIPCYLGVLTPHLPKPPTRSSMAWSTFALTAIFFGKKPPPSLADDGHIINISTGPGRFALRGYAGYAAMKGGVATLTKYLANASGARGIAVNVVAPGDIAADFGGGVVRDNARLNAFDASETAQGRVGMPDDTGGVIASLRSPDTRLINAQRVEASGGIFR